jgi:hypothetical protein
MTDSSKLTVFQLWTIAFWSTVHGVKEQTGCRREGNDLAPPRRGLSQAARINEMRGVAPPLSFQALTADGGRGGHEIGPVGAGGWFLGALHFLKNKKSGALCPLGDAAEALAAIRR